MTGRWLRRQDLRRRRVIRVAVQARCFFYVIFGFCACAQLMSMYRLYVAQPPGSVHFRVQDVDHVQGVDAMVLNMSVPEDPRKEEVIQSIRHAWRGYVEYALDADELLPLTRTGRNAWGHVQWSLVDALDTLAMANLLDDLKAARDHLSHTSFRQNSVLSTFEVTIRLLGGLLSIYEKTHDPLYLEKAKDIGSRILGAFGTPSGLPTKAVHLIFGHPNMLGLFQTRTNSLVGAGSVQLELAQLSHVTKDPKFGRAGRQALEALNHARLNAVPKRALFPLIYNVDTGLATSVGYYTVGSGADSFYEYLLKLYILQGGQDSQLLARYVNAMDDMIQNLVQEFQVNGEAAAILVRLEGSYKVKRMGHLECFVPGMLALGAHYGKRHQIESLASRYTDHMDVAKKLMKTCVHFYTRNPSGLSAEEYGYSTYRDDSLYIVPGQEYYHLRPETVESLFILYRVTGDTAYQDMGWRIFQSIEANCRTDIAYAAVLNVAEMPVRHKNLMESFFLGETLKYLLLLFSQPTAWSLDHYVFTTEAHPFRIHPSVP